MPVTNWTHNKSHPQIELLAKCIEREDNARMELQGGYPSDWVIIEDMLIRAEPDHDGATNLRIVSVADFIAECLANYDDPDEG